METIFKSGYEKIMKIFYNDKSAKIHLRKIARETKLNENSVSRFLNQLEKSKILKSEREGNLKKYSIEKNQLTFSLFSFFDVIRFENLPLLRKNAIKIYLEQLKVKPVILVVFGSTAKKTFREDSDIDILEIVNSKKDNSEARNYAEAQTGIRIQTLQIESDIFKREIKIKQDKTLQSAIETGFPIFNAKYFYEVVYG
ncbi:MAG: nucleotidyltransferase domain-containing protein [Nanoarchaeota archaeon]